MPSRRIENLDVAAFAVGAQYTREEIATLGRVAPLANSREWTGIVEFANCVVLFSTLDKEGLPEEHQYADLFDGDEFKWESQNRNTRSTPVIQKITSGETPVLLFARIRAKNERGRTFPFVYAGQLAATRSEAERPVKVMFDLLDYTERPNEWLAGLYQWRPGDMPTRRLDPVELPSDKKPESSNGRRGQGRQMDAVKREVVERYGMEKCRAYYERLGFALLDTSKTRPFDFEARRGDALRRIEVKGTTGTLDTVVVTSGEVQSARLDGVPTDLVVVHSIRLRECGVGTYEAFGGVMQVVRDWIPEEERLRPTQYEYSVVGKGLRVAFDDEPAEPMPASSTTVR